MKTRKKHTPLAREQRVILEIPPSEDLLSRAARRMSKMQKKLDEEGVTKLKYRAIAMTAQAAYWKLQADIEKCLSEDIHFSMYSLTKAVREVLHLQDDTIQSLHQTAKKFKKQAKQDKIKSRSEQGKELLDQFSQAIELRDSVKE